MKQKFMVFREGESSAVKTFRRESDAVAYVNDPKNVREYGYLRLEMRNAEGVREYDQAASAWSVRHD